MKLNTINAKTTTIYYIFVHKLFVQNNISNEAVYYQLVDDPYFKYSMIVSQQQRSNWITDDCIVNPFSPST